MTTPNDSDTKQEPAEDSREPERDVGPNVVEVVRIMERAKTIRWVSVGVIVLLGVIAIVIGIVKIVEQPPWLTLCLAILVALAGPSGVIYRLQRSRRQYVKKTHQRTVDLEKRLHNQRTSSTPDDS